MAGFRQFHWEKQYEAPDISDFGDQYYASLSNMFGTISDVISKKRNAADQYKYALEMGNFENDNKILTEYGKMVTNQGKNEYLKKGSLSTDLLQKEMEGKRLAADSKAQYKLFSDLKDQVKTRAQDTNDKYYDPEIDNETIREAAIGDGHVDMYTRGERLNAAAAKIGRDPRSFKQKVYTADYVKLFGEKEKTKSTGDVNSKSTSFQKSPFWDPKTGRPGVTDDHAIDFLRTDRRLSDYYDMVLNDQLSGEIKKMKAAGTGNEWMKGMSDAEIKNELINNPSRNTVNSTEYGQRKRDLAKKDLSEAANIQEKVDYESKKDRSVTNGLYNNDGISYTPTVFNTTSSAVNHLNGQVGYAQTGVSEKRDVRYGAPGGILMINKGVTAGKPLSFDIESPNVFNVDTGKKINLKGKAPFNLSGYQLQAYYKDGRPYPLSGQSVDELIQQLNNLSAEEFSKMDPTPSVAMTGYSLDRIGLFNEINTASVDLNVELGNAIKQGDQAQVNAINQRIGILEDLKSSMNDSDVSDQEILTSAARNGITGNRINQIVRADRADLDKINNITQGLNLNDQSKWSDDMKRFHDAYQQNYQQKVGNQAKPSTPESTTKKKFPLPSGKPRTVVQNGFTYTWDESTGEYK